MIGGGQIWFDLWWPNLFECDLVMPFLVKKKWSVVNFWLKLARPLEIGSSQLVAESGHPRPVGTAARPLQKDIEIDL